MGQLHLFARATDVELFAGAGGLALGLAAAGITSAHLYERNPRACLTLTSNKEAGHGKKLGEINEVDVRDVDWTALKRPARLLAAGPPCQPFSLAGNHQGDIDPRNEFPATLRAVRELQPAVVLLENVHGLTRDSFRPYFDYILRQLAFPSIGPSPTAEEWSHHDARLAAHALAVGEGAQEYTVRYGVLNAADYGVPQQRMRVVIIATKRGYPVVELPRPTHSRDSLIHAQETGVYWVENGVARPEDYKVPKRGPAQAEDPEHRLLPWQTVRQALAGLGEPFVSEEHPSQHGLIPGARLYRGHKGSLLDWPSKAIKAGVHGVAGGENIMHLDDGTFRYFTLREMARIQGFPDDYTFHGPRSRIIGQIGNAVPCGLAETLGRSLTKMFRKFPELSDRPKLTVGLRRGSSRNAN
ncbi:MAG: DNA cytosine methyltransferase [Myxococcota bacterium]